MPQVYETQTIEAFGVPNTEYRIAPEIETELITIEFTPDPDNKYLYGYSHPRYTFTETVALRKDWEHCQQHKLNWRDKLILYRICSLHLVEPFCPITRQLIQAPYWLFRVRNYSGCVLHWFSEDELVSVHEMQREIHQEYYEL